MPDVGSFLTGGGVFSVVVAAVNTFSNRKKRGADAAAVFTTMATDLVKAQTEAIVKPLETKVRELETQVEKLSRTAREATAETETCRAEGREKDRTIRAQEARIAELEARR